MKNDNNKLSVAVAATILKLLLLIGVYYESGLFTVFSFIIVGIGMEKLAFIIKKSKTDS